MSDDHAKDSTTTAKKKDEDDNNNNKNETPSPSATAKQADDEEDSVPRCLSLSDWYNDASCGNLLDLRQQHHSDNTKGPTRYSTATTTSTDNNNNNNNKQIVAIPLAEVRARSFELPPRGTPFCVWIDNYEATTTAITAAAAALERFYAQMVPCDSSVVSSSSSLLSRKRKRHVPWNIQGILLNTSENDRQAQELGLLTCRHHEEEDKEAANDSAGRRPFVVQPRLWSPDPLVEHVVLPLLWQTAVSTQQQQQQHAVTSRRIVWDLGAGAGRDACFLAEELRARTSRSRSSSSSNAPSFQVVAMDQRYRTLPHEPCLDFFARRGLTNKESYATCQCVDLKHVEAVLAQLPPDDTGSTTTLAGIVMVRYWNKPLVQALVDASAIRPGTILALSYFGLSSPNATWNFAHPKVRTDGISYLTWCSFLFVTTHSLTLFTLPILAVQSCFAIS